jgi:hypothetical protein
LPLLFNVIGEVLDCLIRWVPATREALPLEPWYGSMVRIYIEPATTGPVMTSYYLLDNIRHFSLHRNGNGSSISAYFGSLDRINVIQNIDEKTAYAAMAELLSLTGASDGEQVAIIRWDGKHFTRTPA